jgi:CheY-like chemotaxis protein
VIVIVDDDTGVRRFMRLVLESTGYRVEEADGGPNALRLLETYRPELLITDIVMPGMNGLEMAAQAHRLDPSLRVIFMTGYRNQFHDELSGSVCLAKPFTSATLLLAVESAIGLPRNSKTAG